MSAFGQIAKQVIKKAPKAAKEVTEKVVKEVADDVVGTTISKGAKEAALMAAEAGEKNITLSQAKKAAVTSYQYAAQKNVEVTDALSVMSSWARDTADKIDSGVITDKQSIKVVNEARKRWGLSKLSQEESTAARSGSAQVMQAGAENADVVLMNDIMSGVDQYMNQNNVRQTLEVLSNIRDRKSLEMLGVLKNEMKQRGQEKSFFDNIVHIGKNIMLLKEPANRLMDGGANFVIRGVSLLELETAQGLQAAGKKLSSVFGGRKLAELLSSPGIYQGSAARSLNGSLVAIKDSTIDFAKNAGRWVTGHGDEITETAIGKHAKKMKAEYLWQTQNEVATFVLPKDIKEAITQIKTHPVRSVVNAGSEVINNAGFAMSQAVDDIPAGAFRAGSLAQDAYQQAYLRAVDIGKQNDKEFIDRLAQDFIRSDNGVPLSKKTLDEYFEMFGPGGYDEIVQGISESATRKAEMDTYRVGHLTKLGGSLEDLYTSARNIKFLHLGKIFDAFYPLARTTIRITDRMFADNPISAMRNVSKAYKKAMYEIEKTGSTNSAEFYAAAGKLAVGSTAYTTAMILTYNNVLMGSRSENKSERSIMEALNKKYDSINIGSVSIPYERFGAPGVMLGTVVNILSDIKDIKEKYDDESNAYDVLSASADLIGTFMTTPVWNTIFGRMAEDFSLGRLTKKTLKQYSLLLPRAFSAVKRNLGFTEDNQVTEYFFDVRKNLLDAKLRSRIRTDMFGNPVTKSFTTKQNEIAKEMADVGTTFTTPYNSNTASVNDEEIQLYPIEKSIWNSFLSHYQVFDKQGNPTGEWTSVEKELGLVMYGGKDATEEGKLYFEIGNTKLAPDGEKQRTKAGILADVYNEAKRNALLTFLSYKDKYVDTDEEKEYANDAIDLWRRSMEAKKKKMQPVPSLNIGE